MPQTPASIVTVTYRLPADLSAADLLRHAKHTAGLGIEVVDMGWPTPERPS
jgi:hypothetical protein